MTETDSRKVLVGAVLLGLSSVLILASRIEALGSALPLVAITLAAVGMAAGTLLLGTSESGRPV